MLIIFSMSNAFDMTIHSKVINIVVYLIAVGYFFLRVNSFLSTFKNNKLLMIFLLYIPLNVMLAYQPSVTLQYSIKLVGITLFSMYIANKLTIQEWLKALMIFFGLLAIASLGAVVLFPGIGKETDPFHYGNWKGILETKNTFGTISVLGFTLFMVSMKWNNKYKKIKLCFVFLYGLFILNSVSKTALVIAALLIVLIIIRNILRKMLKISPYLFLSSITFLILITGFVSFLMYNNFASILTSLGRDATLSGRTVIYDYAIQMIKERLFFGYGYGGFWNNDQFRYTISNIINLTIYSSHSGILDLLLDFGVIGFLLISFLFISTVRRTIKVIKFTKNPLFNWFLIYIIFLLINNLTDSRFIESLGIYWVIFVTISIYAKKHFKQVNDKNKNLVS